MDSGGPGEIAAEPAFSGQVRLHHADRFLGTARVQLRPTQRSDLQRRDEREWSGRIVGSDYLVWGMNHKLVELEFESGERAKCVVLATGILKGVGPTPTCVAVS